MNIRNRLSKYKFYRYACYEFAIAFGFIFQTLIDIKQTIADNWVYHRDMRNHIRKVDIGNPQEKPEEKFKESD